VCRGAHLEPFVARVYELAGRHPCGLSQGPIQTRWDRGLRCSRFPTPWAKRPPNLLVLYHRKAYLCWGTTQLKGCGLSATNGPKSKGESR